MDQCGRAIEVIRTINLVTDYHVMLLTQRSAALQCLLFSNKKLHKHESHEDSFFFFFYRFIVMATISPDVKSNDVVHGAVQVLRTAGNAIFEDF